MGSPNDENVLLLCDAECMLKCETAAQNFKQAGTENPEPRTVLDGGASRDFCKWPIRDFDIVRSMQKWGGYFSQPR